MSPRRNQKQFVVGLKIYFNQFQLIIMSKRRHFGASGNTPGKSRPKRSISVDETNKPARRTLFASSTVKTACTQPNEEWTREEFVGGVCGPLLGWRSHQWMAKHKKNQCFGIIVLQQ